MSRRAVCSGAIHQALHVKIFRQWHIDKGAVIRLSLGRCSMKGYSSCYRGHQGGTVGLQTRDIVFKNESGTLCLQSTWCWEEMITEIQIKFCSCKKSVTCSFAASLKNKQGRYINYCSYPMCVSAPPTLYRSLLLKELSLPTCIICVHFLCVLLLLLLLLVMYI
jgi:hypothetical protein